MTVQIYKLYAEFFDTEPLVLYFTNEIEALIEERRIRTIFKNLKKVEITVDRIKI